MDYKERVHALSQSGKDYLIEQLELGRGIDHLVAYYTSDVKQNANAESVLRQRVEASLPKHMHPTKFIQLEQLPRLSNGKVDQSKLPRLQLNRTEAAQSDLPVIGQNQQQYSRQLNTLIEILESLLDFEGILPTDNFFELGGDSITAIRLVSRAREAGVNISVASVAVESDLQSLVSAAVGDAELSVEAPSPFGESPLTPIQKWFFGIEHPQAARWNIGGRLALAESTDTVRLQKAIECCLARHSELGAQFHQRDGQWSCFYPESEAPSGLCKLSPVAQGDHLDSFLAECGEAFSLRNGWMIRFAIVGEQAGSATELVWVAHHLIIDQLSIQTLLEEIERIYSTDDYSMDAFSGLSMRAWALACEVESKKRAEHASQVLQQSNRHGEQSPIYTTVKATESNVVSIEQKLDFASASIMQGIADRHDCDISSLLIAALAVAWKHAFLVDTLAVDIEGHGRDLLGDNVDNANSVGWYSAFYPVDLTIGDTANTLSMKFISRVRQQIEQQKQVNSKFLLYGALSEGMPSPFGNNGRVLVNFLGGSTERKNSFFTALPMATEGLRSSNNLRAHNVEINASFDNGQLNVLWSLSSTCMSVESKEQLTRAFVSYMQELCDSRSVQSSESIANATSNFPDIDMNQTDLDEFLDSLE